MHRDNVYILRLGEVRLEYEAARAALAYAEQIEGPLKSSSALLGVSHLHLRAALNNCERTYLIRLFTEFDASLRDSLAHTKSRQSRRNAEKLQAKELVDHVARVHGIGDHITEGVHAVREYRNTVVHPGRLPATVVSFQDALTALNRFLASLPMTTSP